jgi:membrane-associated PAP2 superfamily phosphatase
LRSRPTRLRFAAVVASVLFVVGLGGILHRRPDFDAYPAGRLLALVTLYFGGVLLAFGKELYVSIRHGTLADYGGLFIGALGLPFLIAFAPATEASGHAGPGGAWSCFVYGGLLTLPTAALLWAFDRDDRPSVRTVCLSAVSLGLSANLVLELHCPSGNVLHLLLGHASIGLAWLAAWFVVRQASQLRA